MTTRKRTSVVVSPVPEPPAPPEDVSVETPPSTLSDAAKKWWKTVATTFELEPWHILLLNECAFSWDRAQEARRIVDRDGRGREIHTTGDGFLATFDGPGRAVRCACAIRDAVRAIGIEVRVGLHTGEIELHSDDICGIAVHIAQRVQVHAEPDEVLVSRTVVDLVGGSGITFADGGTHALKGVPDKWQLFAETQSLLAELAMN